MPNLEYFLKEWTLYKRSPKCTAYAVSYISEMVAKGCCTSQLHNWVIRVLKATSSISASVLIAPKGVMCIKRALSESLLKALKNSETRRDFIFWDLELEQ